MGCDIHIYTERKRRINNKDVWVNADYFGLNPYYTGACYEKKFEVIKIYGDRNYSLFSMLANVRNEIGQQFVCNPRGLPEDSSNFVKTESDSWGCDGHSHSYLTLKELKEFREKNKTTKYSGMMPPLEAEKVDSGEMPEYWCGGTNQKHYVYREWEYESDILKDLVDSLEKRKVEWGTHNNNPDVDEKIRIVFWFDN